MLKRSVYNKQVNIQHLPPSETANIAIPELVCVQPIKFNRLKIFHIASAGLLLLHLGVLC